MATLKTAQEMAEMYQGIVDTLVTSGLQEYNVPHRGGYRKISLAEAEEGLRYWSGQADRETYGTGNLVSGNGGYSGS